MVINKSSWHYRFIRWGRSGRSMPNSLCEYVRTLAFACIMAVIGVLVVLALSWFMLVLPVELWLMQFGVIEYVKDEFVGGVIAHGIWVFCFCCTGAVKYIEWRDANRTKKPARKPSVIGAYFQAKKQKICPIVEYQ
jgi:hypothetical protein